MCINCLPSPAEVLGNNLEPTPIEAGGTDISGALKEPITQPARTYGYFTWSQKKRQDGAPPMVGGPKCPSETKGPKPNPGSQTKTKEQAGGALGGDKRVPSQKKSGRGWANKTRVQGSSLPTNDSITPSQTKFGRGLSRNPRLRLVGAFHLVQQCCARSSWMTQILGHYWDWRSQARDPLAQKCVPQALQPGTIGIVGNYCKYKMACWCAILWDVMQQAIICSSLYLGHCVMKFCTIFMIPC